MDIDTEKALNIYFKHHDGDWCNAKHLIHRTIYTRQMANMWWIKEKRWLHVLRHLRFDGQISLINNFLLPICRFAPGHRCRRLREVAAYDYDDVPRKTLLGLRAHLRVCLPGAIVAFRLSPTDSHDLQITKDIFTEVPGLTLDDHNYWSSDLFEALRAN